MLDLSRMTCLRWDNRLYILLLWYRPLWLLWLQHGLHASLSRGPDIGHDGPGIDGAGGSWFTWYASFWLIYLVFMILDWDLYTSYILLPYSTSHWWILMWYRLWFIWTLMISWNLVYLYGLFFIWCHYVLDLPFWWYMICSLILFLDALFILCFLGAKLIWMHMLCLLSLDRCLTCDVD